MSSRVALIAIVGAVTYFVALLTLTLVLAVASTVAGPLLIAGKIGSLFSGNDEARQRLEALSEETIDGVKISDILFSELDCAKASPSEHDAGLCIEAPSQEHTSPIPPDKEWLVPIWKKAAGQYNIPWELLAAVNAARTDFGNRDCDVTAGGARLGAGFYRVYDEAWDDYGDEGKKTGHAVVVGPDKEECYVAAPPKSEVLRDKADGQSSRFDPVDASFAMAKQLAEHGARGKTAWVYGADTPTGLPRAGEPNIPYQGDLFTGNLGRAPDALTPLADIPRNYLILYVLAGRASNIDWEYLAAKGKMETNHGRSELPGITSGINQAKCCSGPMQWNLKDTWKQPGWESMWIGSSSSVGRAFDHNKDGKIDVWDPRDAIPAAGLLTAERLKSYNGDHRLVFASYNAGPGAVAQYHGVPPYAETQNYVANGMKYAAEYRAAADRNPELIDRLLRSLEQGSEEQRECKGDSPDDDVSKAVAWSGKNINSSPCYVAIVYEWYKAIIADPPGLINGISIGDFPPHLRYVDANEVRLPPGPGYLMYVGCGYGSRGSDVHRGRADLIALIQSVGKVWNVSHPNQPFLVGDITSPNSCHASHLVGEDVDLAWPTDASRAGYSAAFAQEFLSMYVLGGAEVIFFTPLDGRMGNAAMDAVVQQWPNHTNHSHVRIDGARGTYPGKVLRLIEPIPRGGV